MVVMWCGGGIISGDLLGDSRMSNVFDKSFIHRSYPKLAYGSMYIKGLRVLLCTFLVLVILSVQHSWRSFVK